MPHRAKIDNRNELGYSLIEMLIVTGIILILATVPIAYLRSAREKSYEAEAVRSLREIALGYENYYAQYGHQYPNYVSTHVVDIKNGAEFRTAEELWDTMMKYSLIPRRYSGIPHNEPNLMAHGYYFSIYPADYGTIPGWGYQNTYAFGLFPNDQYMHKKGIVMIRGQRFFSNFPTTVPRKSDGTTLFSLSIYTLND